MQKYGIRFILSEMIINIVNYTMLKKNPLFNRIEGD